MLLALQFVYVNCFTYIYGLRFTTATNAALLEACIPVYTMVIGLVIGSEVWGKGCNCVKKALGLTFCTGGTILVVLASDRAQGHLNMSNSRHLYGNVLLWISTVCCRISLLFKNHGHNKWLFFKIMSAHFFLQRHTPLFVSRGTRVCMCVLVSALFLYFFCICACVHYVCLLHMHSIFCFV